MSEFPERTVAEAWRAIDSLRATLASLEVRLSAFEKPSPSGHPCVNCGLAERCTYLEGRCDALAARAESAEKECCAARVELAAAKTRLAKSEALGSANAALVEAERDDARARAEKAEHRERLRVVEREEARAALATERTARQQDAARLARDVESARQDVAIRWQADYQRERTAREKAQADNGALEAMKADLAAQLDAAWKAAGLPVRGLRVPLAEVVAAFKSDREAARAEAARLRTALGEALAELEAQFGGPKDQDENEAGLLRRLRDALTPSPSEPGGESAPRDDMGETPRPRWRWWLNGAAFALWSATEWRWAMRLFAWTIRPEWVATPEELAEVHHG